PGDGSRRDRVRRDRDRDGGRAGAIEEIDLHGKRVQQVRERQPHGADLLPAGRDAVGDPPRDDEVAARVVVAEREPERVVVPRGASGGGGGGAGRGRGQGASRRRYNPLFILWVNSLPECDRSPSRSADRASRWSRFSTPRSCRSPASPTSSSS